MHLWRTLASRQFSDEVGLTSCHLIVRGDYCRWMPLLSPARELISSSCICQLTPNVARLSTSASIKNDSTHTYTHTSIIQVNLYQMASTFKSWRILLERSFTAHMPLLMATSTFKQGKRHCDSVQWCYVHCLLTVGKHYISNAVIAVL